MRRTSYRFCTKVLVCHDPEATKLNGGGLSVKSFVQMATTLIATIIPVAAAEAQVRLSVDPGKTAAPISKYVYGQFAEHLGRSIYGGLWAEMIEDRKFAHEITDEYNPFDLANDSYGKPAAFTYLKNSPWKVIGPKGTVTMEKAGAYVGDWSPVIHLPGDGKEAGISEGNEPYNGAAGFLAVERGKKYFGHIVLASLILLIPVTEGIAAQLGVGLPVTLLSLLIRFLELFVAFLQAYIFTFLATLFIASAIAPEH